jgi:hypothetical protein
MPLNRPECLPLKFVIVTQIGTGPLAPPLNPRGSMPRCARIGPPDGIGPPINSPPTGATGKPESAESENQCHPSVKSASKMGPPASSEGTDASRRPMLGATPRSGTFDATRHAETRTTAGQMARIIGTTRQFRGRQTVPPPVFWAGAGWGHSPVRLQRPVGTTLQFASNRGGREAQISATRHLRTPPRWFPHQDGATREFEGNIRMLGATPPSAPTSATPQSFGAAAVWGHPPSTRRRQPPRMVPPVGSESRQAGATRQSGGANLCHPSVHLRQIRPGSSKQCP